MYHLKVDGFMVERFCALHFAFCTLRALAHCLILSVWFLITIFGPAIAGFLGPGRIALGAHFGGVLGGVYSTGIARSARHYIFCNTHLIYMVDAKNDCQTHI